MKPKFIIKKSTDNQYYFVLSAPNHEVILTSELYTQKQNCYNGIESVLRNTSRRKFEQRRAADTQFYFLLKASNGEIIGTSEMYTTAHNCAAGIEAVIQYAQFADTIDRTYKAPAPNL